MTTSIALQVQVPAKNAQEAVDFCVEFQRLAMEAGLDDLLAGIEVDSPAERTEFTIQDQLDRFKGNWGRRHDSLLAIHNGLLELGYEAHLPDIRGKSSKPAQYIRYVDPVGGASKGATNSGSFTFIGRALQDRLRDTPGVEITRDGARFQFDTEEKVNLILGIARDIKD